MKYLDKNSEKLYVGAIVDVPTPTIEDQWDFEFEGQIIGFYIDYCIVEDGDGDCWAVEPERLELS